MYVYLRMVSAFRQWNVYLCVLVHVRTTNV